MEQYIQHSRFKHLLYAILGYNLCVVFAFTDILSPNICHVMEFVFVLYIYMYINVKSLYQKDCYASFLLLALIVWYLFIICNNIGDSLSQIGLTIVDNQGISCMILLLIVKQYALPSHLNDILKYSLICTFLYGLLLLFKANSIQALFFQGEMVHAHTIFESLHTYLGGGLIFLLLFQNLLSKRKRQMVNILAVITIVVAALLGRRGILLLYLVTYTVYAFIHIKYFESKKARFIVLVLVFFYILSYLVMAYGEQYFGFLYDRFLDDTRTETQNELLADLGNSNDLIIGRGLSGSYKSFFLDLSNRTGIETGYLNMVLKGGWIYVVIFFLFVIPGLLKGLFCSNNFVVRMLALYGLVWIFYFNTSSSNMSLSIRYFIFLYCVYICYVPKYRLLNNSQMTKLVKLKLIK